MHRHQISSPLRRIVITTVVAGLATCGFLASQAAASSPSPDAPALTTVAPGPDLPAGYSPARFAASQPGLGLKSHAAAAYAEALKDPSKSRAAQTAFRAWAKTYAPGAPDPSVSSVTPNCSTCYVLTGETQYAEGNGGTWCGPAAAQAILANGLGKWTSHSGLTLSQPNLANEYIPGNGTLYQRGSGTNLGAVAPGLNIWIGGSTTGWYITQPSPATTTLVADMEFDINNNHPLAADLVEFPGAGNAHLYGHPTTGTIYHWVSIKGYESFPKVQPYVVDPAAGAGMPGFQNAVPYAVYDPGFLNAMVIQRGIAW